MESPREAARAAAEQFENNNRAEAEMSLEDLKNKSTLQIEARGNFNPLLDALNAGRSDKPLTPRPEGFHVTILGPADSSTIKALDENHLRELRLIASAIGRGEGVTVQGVGTVDSSTEPNLLEKDREKSVAFLALDIPALQQFRADVGLPPKDFHITLGFNGADIHFRQQLDENGTSKKDIKGKPVTEFVPKKADPEFTEKFKDLIPTLEFQGLGGREKQEAQEDLNAALLAELQQLIASDADLQKWNVNAGTLDTHVGKHRDLDKKIEKTAEELLKELKEKVAPKLFDGESTGELVRWLQQNGLGKNIGEVRGKLAGLLAGTSKETVVSCIQGFSIPEDKKSTLEAWVDSKNLF